MSVLELFGHGGFPLWSPGSFAQTIGVVSASAGGVLLPELRVSTTPSTVARIASATTPAAAGQK